MKKEQVVLELYESINTNGLIETIHAVFGKGILLIVHPVRPLLAG